MGCFGYAYQGAVDFSEFQRLIVLFRFRYRRAVIALARQQHGWRGYIANQGQRRANPVSLRILPGEFFEPVFRNHCVDIAV